MLETGGSGDAASVTPGFSTVDSSTVGDSVGAGIASGRAASTAAASASAARSSSSSAVANSISQRPIVNLSPTATVDLEKSRRLSCTPAPQRVASARWESTATTHCSGRQSAAGKTMVHWGLEPIVVLPSANVTMRSASPAARRTRSESGFRNNVVEAIEVSGSVRSDIRRSASGRSGCAAGSPGGQQRVVQKRPR